MKKKDGNERGTSGRLLFGTWLTNGLVLSVGGTILFFIGLSVRGMLEHRLHVAFGGTNFAAMMMGGGIIALLTGVVFIGIHLSKKKT